MSELQIDIWSDVMCPWCAVGYANLRQAQDMLGGEIALSVRWMPFELDPTTSPEGTSKQQRLETVYGYTPDQAREASARMLDAARAAGFPLDYDGAADPPPEAMMWNTLDAHKLLRWAYASAGAEAQTALKLALFTAHFRERRNVSDRAVLCAIADGINGLSAQGAADALEDEALGQAVRAEQQRIRAAGLNGVPAFVVAGKYALQGAQPPEALVDAFRQIAAKESG